MALFMTIFLVLCAGLFALSEGRGGRGRSSSGGGWRSSGSSSSSSSSSGSSWSPSSSSGSSWSPSSSSGSSWSPSSSSGSSWSSPSSSSVSSGSSVPSGSSGSHPGSPSGRRDNPSGESSSFGKDNPNSKSGVPFGSPPSSMTRSNKPGKQTGSSDDDSMFGSSGSQSPGVYNARLWRRTSWTRYNRPYSRGRSSSDYEFEGSGFDTNETYIAENPTPTIYDMIPNCEALGAAMWAKYDELTQNGEMSSNSCEDDDNPEVCIRQDIEKVRCAVTEGIPKECVDKILAFIRGGVDICNEIAEEKEMAQI